jgi:hypothetical protein
MIRARLRTYKTRTPAGGLAHVVRVYVAGETVGPLDVLMGMVPALAPGFRRQYVLAQQKRPGLVFLRAVDGPALPTPAGA